MKHKTTWWRPDGWLRLIYGVWANQLWYWQHVRPLLDDPRQRKRIFVQAVLGTIVVTLALSLIPIYILTAAGAKTSVSWMFAGTLFGLVITAIWKTYKLKGDPNAVADSVFFGLGLGLATSVRSGFNEGFSDGITRGFAEGAGLGLAIGLVAGIGYSVRTGLIKGAGPITPIVVLAPLCTFVCSHPAAFDLAGYLAGPLVSAMVAFPAAYLGYRWAIRQVPDEETRKQLANPEGTAEQR
jgi:hypothetical protein